MPFFLLTREENFESVSSELQRCVCVFVCVCLCVCVFLCACVGVKY